MTKRSGGPTVIFSGGGTGGHLYPALALAGALEALRPDVQAVFVGARRGIEARVLPRRGVDHHLLPVEGFRREGVLAQLATNLAVLRGLARSLVLLGGLFRERRPELVVVTGGYAGGPAGIMAILTGVKLVLQEQNSVPGLTTRVLSRFCRQIHLAFPEARAHLPRRARSRARVSGNPVQTPSAVERKEAARHFDMDPGRPVILVVGGSQGSLALNDAVLRGIEAQSRANPSDPGFQLLWSTGPSHVQNIRASLAELGSPGWVRPVGYIHEMSSALGLADLAVSRAGAMATSEFQAWGLPSLLVPLPTAAADHQRANAHALVEAGAAEVVEEDTLDRGLLWERVTALARDPRAREAMARRARDRGRPHAAREIAEELAALLPPPPRGVASAPDTATPEATQMGPSQTEEAS